MSEQENTHIQMEFWDNEIVRFEKFPFYGADKKGNIYSFKKPNKIKKLKLSTCVDGEYKKVGLRVEKNKVRWLRVNRLMGHAFLGLDIDNIDLDVDHINNDKKNNELSNLRLATRSQNLGARSKLRNNTSGFKGVRYAYKTKKNKKKWRAEISCNNVYYNLGHFSTKEEAARAYDKKAKELFGEFANINFN